jgi:hypothetical protein
MTESREHKYTNRSKRRGKHPKDKEPIGPTNLPPVEENKQNNGRLTAEQLKSLRDHIDYLMKMEKSGIKPT